MFIRQLIRPSIRLCTRLPIWPLIRRWLLPVYGLALVGVVVMADIPDLLGAQSGIGVGNSLGGLVSSVPGGDKVGHFLLFGTLGFLVNAWLGRSGCSVLTHVKVTLLVSLVVLVEELSQIYLPHRNFDVFDIVADLAGIILFSIFAYWWMRRRVDA